LRSEMRKRCAPPHGRVYTEYIQCTYDGCVIKSALSEYLRRVETTMQLREKAVESYLDDKLTYNELAVAIGRQNAESVKVSKRLLERSNRIAEDIARG